MNITEANAVNTLLHWVTGHYRPHTHRQPVTSDEARDAAAYLADRADKTLMAGLRGRDVTENWPTEAAKGRRRKVAADG